MTTRTTATATGPVNAPPSASAVRVSLAPTSGHANLPPIVVSPPGPDGSDESTELIWVDGERAVLLRHGEQERREHVLVMPATRSRGTERGVVRREVVVDGWKVELDLEHAAHAALRDRARRGTAEAGHSGPIEVRAMIPGVVVSVPVAVGEAVTRGQRVIVLEAMKMQNELPTPRDGVIERIVVGQGDKIEVGDLLLVIT